jgi:large subunit ribosomal protein L9
MEVILLKKVDNLGDIGDRVKVRSGYGRNFLVPRGKASPATAANIAIIEKRRAELEGKQAEELAAAEGRAVSLRELGLKLPAKAGTAGKLFGSIGTIDIAAACVAAGVPVERSEVRLPDGPIRALGEFEIEIHLNADVNVPVRIEVVPDGELVAEEEGEIADPFEPGEQTPEDDLDEEPRD